MKIFNANSILLMLKNINGPNVPTLDAEKTSFTDFQNRDLCSHHFNKSATALDLSVFL